MLIHLYTKLVYQLNKVKSADYNVMVPLQSVQVLYFVRVKRWTYMYMYVYVTGGESLLSALIMLLHVHFLL